MNLLTVHTARLSSVVQSYLRECTWCVLGGTFHQWLYINRYRCVEHCQQKWHHFSSIFSSKYIYQTTPIHPPVRNSHRFQVPALASISLPPRLQYSTCFSTFSIFRHSTVLLSLTSWSRYHKHSLPNSSFDPHRTTCINLSHYYYTFPSHGQQYYFDLHSPTVPSSLAHGMQPALKPYSRTLLLSSTQQTASVPL